MRETLLWKNIDQELRIIAQNLIELTVKQPELHFFYGKTIQDVTEQYKVWSAPLFYKRMEEWKQRAKTPKAKRK